MNFDGVGVYGGLVAAFAVVDDDDDDGCSRIQDQNWE